MYLVLSHISSRRKRFFKTSSYINQIIMKILKETLSQLKCVLNYVTKTYILKIANFYILLRKNLSIKKSFSTCYSCQWFNIEPLSCICSHQNHSSCSIIQCAGIGSCYCWVVSFGGIAYETSFSVSICRSIRVAADVIFSLFFMPGYILWEIMRAWTRVMGRERRIQELSKIRLTLHLIEFD